MEILPYSLLLKVRLRVDKEMADIADYMGRQMTGHFTVQHENRKQKVSVKHRYLI